MIVQLTAPSSLLFGLARLRTNQLAWLGITLQHPPIVIGARPASALSVTGARADLAHTQATRVMQRLGLPAAEVEIEMASPRYMGLGSEPMLGLAVARSLAALTETSIAGHTLALADALGLDERDALAVHGFDHGGMLLVPADNGAGRWPAPLRRRNLDHPDDNSWAWVLHWPPTPPGTPSALEAGRLAQLLAAAPHLSDETGRLVEDELWPALERDDSASFGRALMGFQQLNQAALEKAGTALVGTPDTEGVLAVLRENGAQAWGESAAGLARFGLIRGGSPSVVLRRALVKYLGYEGGTVMAAICDVTGARHRLSPESEGIDRYD
jgi:predicted sugar kinase